MKGTHVLIIDDEKVIRESVARTLEKAGYETTTAGSLLGAVELIQSKKFDLIICDVMIPHIGGLELVDKLKADPAFSAIPIILMTGMDKDILNATMISADAVITKPFDSSQLLEEVKNQLLAKQV
jgi:two-component system, sensor histidine kinase and response regulator